MRKTISTYTKEGTRPINEDYVAFREEEDNAILIVADGLGGHDKGEVASKHVATFIQKEYHFESSPKEELGTVIKNAQNSLLELQRQSNTINASNAMKTTVVVLAINHESAYIAHVGDSRAYVFGKGKKYSRTMDHSVPQMLALAGDIKEKDIRHHKERGSLLRVLGAPWEKDAYEISERIELKNVKAMLLCTDGFWELIEEKDMMKCLKKAKSPEEWLDMMRKIVEKNGDGKEMDNYTAGAVFITEK